MAYRCFSSVSLVSIRRLSATNSSMAMAALFHRISKGQNCTSLCTVTNRRFNSISCPIDTKPFKNPFQGHNLFLFVVLRFLGYKWWEILVSCVLVHFLIRQTEVRFNKLAFVCLLWLETDTVVRGLKKHSTLDGLMFFLHYFSNIFSWFWIIISLYMKMQSRSCWEFEKLLIQFFFYKEKNMKL